MSGWRIRALGLLGAVVGAGLLLAFAEIAPGGGDLSTGCVNAGDGFSLCE